MPDPILTAPPETPPAAPPAWNDVISSKEFILGDVPAKLTIGRDWYSKVASLAEDDQAAEQIYNSQIDFEKSLHQDAYQRSVVSTMPASMRTPDNISKMMKNAAEYMAHVDMFGDKNEAFIPPHPVELSSGEIDDMAASIKNGGKVPELFPSELAKVNTRLAEMGGGPIESALIKTYIDSAGEDGNKGVPYGGRGAGGPYIGKEFSEKMQPALEAVRQIGRVEQRRNAAQWRDLKDDKGAVTQIRLKPDLRGGNVWQLKTPQGIVEKEFADAVPNDRDLQQFVRENVDKFSELQPTDTFGALLHDGGMKARVEAITDFGGIGRKQGILSSANKIAKEALVAEPLRIAGGALQITAANNPLGAANRAANATGLYDGTVAPIQWMQRLGNWFNEKAKAVDKQFPETQAEIDNKNLNRKGFRWDTEPYQMLEGASHAAILVGELAAAPEIGLPMMWAGGTSSASEDIYQKVLKNTGDHEAALKQANTYAPVVGLVSTAVMAATDRMLQIPGSKASNALSDYVMDMIGTGSSAASRAVAPLKSFGIDAATSAPGDFIATSVPMGLSDLTTRVLDDLASDDTENPLKQKVVDAIGSGWDSFKQDWKQKAAGYGTFSTILSLTKAGRNHINNIELTADQPMSDFKNINDPFKVFSTDDRHHVFTKSGWMSYDSPDHAKTTAQALNAEHDLFNQLTESRPDGSRVYKQDASPELVQFHGELVKKIDALAESNKLWNMGRKSDVAISSHDSLSDAVNEVHRLTAKMDMSPETSIEERINKFHETIVDQLVDQSRDWERERQELIANLTDGTVQTAKAKEAAAKKNDIASQLATDTSLTNDQKAELQRKWVALDRASGQNIKPIDKSEATKRADAYIAELKAAARPDFIGEAMQKVSDTFDPLGLSDVPDGQQTAAEKVAIIRRDELSANGDKRTRYDVVFGNAERNKNFRDAVASVANAQFESPAHELKALSDKRRGPTLLTGPEMRRELELVGVRSINPLQFDAMLGPEVSAGPISGGVLDIGGGEITPTSGGLITSDFGLRKVKQYQPIGSLIGGIHDLGPVDTTPIEIPPTVSKSAKESATAIDSMLKAAENFKQSAAGGEALWWDLLQAETAGEARARIEAEQKSKAADTLKPKSAEESAKAIEEETARAEEINQSMIGRELLKEYLSGVESTTGDQVPVKKGVKSAKESAEAIDSALKDLEALRQSPIGGRLLVEDLRARWREKRDKRNAQRRARQSPTQKLAETQTEEVIPNGEEKGKKEGEANANAQGQEALLNSAVTEVAHQAGISGPEAHAAIQSVDPKPVIARIESDVFGTRIVQSTDSKPLQDLAYWAKKPTTTAGELLKEIVGDSKNSIPPLTEADLNTLAGELGISEATPEAIRDALIDQFRPKTGIKYSAKPNNEAGFTTIFHDAADLAIKMFKEGASFAKYAAEAIKKFGADFVDGFKAIWKSAAPAVVEESKASKFEKPADSGFKPASGYEEMARKLGLNIDLAKQLERNKGMSAEQLANVKIHRSTIDRNFREGKLTDVEYERLIDGIHYMGKQGKLAYAVQPMWKYLRDIHPDIGNAAKQMAFDQMRYLKDFTERAKGLEKELLKLNASEDAELFKLHRTNDTDGMKAFLAKRPELAKELNAWFTEHAPHIRNTAGKNKMEIGLIDNYLPSGVKEGIMPGTNRTYFDALHSELMGSEFSSKITEAWDKAEKKTGGPISEDEKARIAMGILGKSGGDKRSLPGNAKSRKLSYVDGMEKYFKTNAKALGDYINRMPEGIVNKRYFGVDEPTWAKGIVLDEHKPIPAGSVIGTILGDLVNSGKITAQNEADATRAFRTYTNYKPSPKYTKVARALNVYSALSSPLTAIKMLGHAIPDFYENGILNNLGSSVEILMGKKVMTMADIGMPKTLDLLKGGDLHSAAEDLIWRAAGFKMLDNFAGNVSTAAWTKRMMKLSDADRLAYVKSFEKTLNGVSPESVADQLKRGEMSTETQWLAFNNLAEIRPVSLISMPLAYLENPHARLAYSLKTYMVHQADYFRERSFAKIYDGATRGDRAMIATGLKGLMMLGGLLTASGVGFSSMTNYVLGKPNDWHDQILDAMIHNVSGGFFSTYLLGKLQEGKVIPTLAEAWLSTPLVQFGEKRVEEIKKIYSNSQEGDVSLFKGIDPTELIGSLPIPFVNTAAKMYHWRYSEDGVKNKMRALKAGYGPAASTLNERKIVLDRMERDGGMARLQNAGVRTEYEHLARWHKMKTKAEDIMEDLVTHEAANGRPEVGLRAAVDIAHYLDSVADKPEKWGEAMKFFGQQIGSINHRKFQEEKAKR